MSKEIGNYYENKAIEFLLKNNFRILGRNLRYARIEVDILAEKENVLHVIEVKYRSDLNYLRINFKQMERLQNYILINFGNNFFSLDLIIFNRDKMYFQENIHLN
jgi:putative endonuclease